MEVIRTIQAVGSPNTPGRTLFDKIWSQHCVKEVGRDTWLLHVDRHLIHDLVAGPALTQLAKGHRIVRSPELTYATVDHGISSAPGRTTDSSPVGSRLLRQMRQRVYETGIQLFDLGQDGQGIVHVMGPELGLTFPGMLVVCGDSHTCTHGGLGAIAFGIGSSEVVHVLATQTLRQRKPASMRIHFDGQPGPQVTAKDLILFAIGELGSAAGRGHAVEYAGSTVRAFDVESRLTMCNLSIELGAKIGLIAPDDVTFDYVSRRKMAPKGAMLEQAIAYWRSLPSDEDAGFALEHRFDAAKIAPQITWGTSPQDVISVTGRVPDPADELNSERRQRMQSALQYMGLQPGAAIAGTKIDWIFIGSCANSRLSDLRLAAQVVGDRKVAPGVRAWVVPGSEAVMREAQREGLDRVFKTAGFEWREPGCSLCLAANGEFVGPGERCLSTSNRNFVGRQGRGARTHLASPAMAAAAAVTGVITDVRHMAAG
jgi:3-isopropylmalate/(R)-2-methylmalate dehydratase large subunit